MTAAIVALSACGGGRDYRPVSDVPVRIGQPYTVRGTTYTPAADAGYDRVGYASWYGPESGDQTANGERFRPDGITAAHTTLPLPTYVEVTALDTGRRIVVRVNDRGPFAGGAHHRPVARRGRAAGCQGAGRRAGAGPRGRAVGQGPRAAARGQAARGICRRFPGASSRACGRDWRDGGELSGRAVRLPERRTRRMKRA